MHRLALVAITLVLCMPVIGRWQQVTHAARADAADMCLSGAALDGAGHGGHLPLPVHPVQPQGSGNDHHHPEGDHDHAAACGYCTLATRLPPLLALVLAVPPPPPLRHSGAWFLPAPPASPLWPAHNPRGPPV